VQFVASPPPVNPILAARATLAVLTLLTVAGLVLGWNKGQLPHREPPAPAETESADVIAPDLALYRELILAVRGGANYYDAAREAIPRYGFPISSPLNWRLPTYAWLFATLPNKCWIQALLLFLAIAGLWLSFLAISRQSSIGHAGLTTFLLFGVIRWTFDGEAYLAQEVWATVLLLISISAHALIDRPKPALLLSSAPPRLRVKLPSLYSSISLAAGLSALFFRELALPYCGIACLLAAWNRRWLDAATWAVGIVAFFAFLAWHIDQVHAQLAGTEVAAAAGLAQWLRFGGLNFVLLTTRMNSLLFAAPPFLLWLYLLAALVGLSSRRDDTSHLACLTALAYLVTFAFVGRPENFYWGLLPAPLLAFGVAFAPGKLHSLLRDAQRSEAAPGLETCSTNNAGEESPAGA
jgi:hypothetical protein